MNTRFKMLLGAMLCAPLLAAVAATDETSKTTSAIAEMGMRVFVDPATGQLVSSPVTAEQKRAVEAIDESFRQDDSGLQIVYMADGSSMMDLQGRFQMATVVEAQADGKLRTYCNDADHLKLGKHAHDTAAAPVATTTAREER